MAMFGLDSPSVNDPNIQTNIGQVGRDLEDLFVWESPLASLAHNGYMRVICHAVVLCTCLNVHDDPPLCLGLL
jgi:hypothetical protein